MYDTYIWSPQEDIIDPNPPIDEMFGSGGKHITLNALEWLNWVNIIGSLFTFLLFLVVRCPVTFLEVQEHTGSKALALLAAATDEMTLYYFGYTIVAILAKYYPFCQSLLLLDVCVKSSTTANVLHRNQH